MHQNGFIDILIKLIECFTLGEDILTYTPGAPEFTVIVDFKLHQHLCTLYSLCEP
jgi:hypothetical protein